MLISSKGSSSPAPPQGFGFFFNVQAVLGAVVRAEGLSSGCGGRHLPCGLGMGDSSIGLFSLTHLTSAEFYHSADKQTSLKHLSFVVKRKNHPAVVKL